MKNNYGSGWNERRPKSPLRKPNGTKIEFSEPVVILADESAPDADERRSEMASRMNDLLDDLVKASLEEKFERDKGLGLVEGTKKKLAATFADEWIVQYSSDHTISDRFVQHALSTRTKHMPSSKIIEVLSSVDKGSITDKAALYLAFAYEFKRREQIDKEKMDDAEQFDH